MGLWDNEPDDTESELPDVNDLLLKTAATLALGTVGCVAKGVCESVMDTLYFLAGEEREEDD